MDFHELQSNDFPQIEDVRAVNCLRGDGFDEGDSNGPNEYIQRLRTRILTILETSEQLDSVHTPVPQAWIRVREELRRHAGQEKVLTLHDYTRICMSPSDEKLRVTNPDEQRGLLRMLHQTGIVVTHGLTDETRDLNSLTLLDPNWLTTAIYALLADIEVRNRNGLFDRQLLAEVLERRLETADQYPTERLDYVIELMQEPRFGLALRLSGSKDNPRYLLPEALPPTAPDLIHGWDPTALRFRYRYQDLSRGLIPQFIVASAEYSTEDASRWRGVCTLQVNGCPVLVTSSIKDDQVDVQVAGPSANRAVALGFVRTIFDALHNRQPESGAEAYVPLHDQPNVDERLGHLQAMQQKHGTTFELDIDGAPRAYSLAELLNPINPPQGISVTTNAEMTAPTLSGYGIGNSSNQVKQLGANSPNTLERADVGAGVRAAVGAALGAVGGLIYLASNKEGLSIEPILAAGGIGGVIAGSIGLLAGFMAKRS